MTSWLASIFGIFLVDLVLSGDNAVVIGLTASGLPREQRMVAIIVGGGGAVITRILFALAATLLLQLRFVGVIGSIILLLIAIHLLVERSNEGKAKRSHRTSITKPHPNEQESQTEPRYRQTDRPAQKKNMYKNLLISIITILLADVTMSLDNVLAVGGLAAGNIPTLIIGLLFSVTFLLIGSALIAEIISRLPWLLDLACLVVAWTAAQIFLGDDSLNDLFALYPWITYTAPIVVLTIVLTADILLHLRDRQHTAHP